MTGRRLLLDEMLSGEIARQLRCRGHDVEAVVDNSALLATDDEALLEWAASAGQCLVTMNIKDFAKLDKTWKRRTQSHGGLLFLVDGTFPRGRALIGRVVEALDAVLTSGEVPKSDEVDFLQQRH